MHKKILLLATILAVIALFSGCEYPVDGATTNATEATIISIPGTLVAENFTFTIVSAELSDSVTLDSGVNIAIDADEGKQFLTLCIDATNTSNEVRNLGPFTTYVDNTTVSPHNVLGKYGDRVLMVGAVHPGKTMSVYAMYQVSMDWEFFEISYIDTLTCKASGSVKFSRSDVK